MSYSFEQHKIVGAIEADDEYWRGLEDGVFKLSRCAACKTWIWPAHHRCGTCGSWELEWVALEPVGKVFTYTRTRYAFDRVIERAEDVPYVTVVAEIPAADNVRVMGLLAGDETGLAIGAEVRGLILPPSAKTKHYPSLCWQLQR
jgi:uncharacterized OB-fold protein